MTADTSATSAWNYGLLSLLFAVLAGLMLSAAASISEASPATDRAPIGPHAPILTLEKNENPQNILVIFTKMDAQCSFELQGKQPVLSDYWLINRQSYKPVNPLIQQGIQKRISIVAAGKPDAASKKPKAFHVRLNDFTELKHDLGRDPMLTVRSEKTETGCAAEAVMKLGPADGGRSIQIKTLYANSKKKLLPPFRELTSLTLKGTDVATGEAISKTYLAR